MAAATTAAAAGCRLRNIEALGAMPPCDSMKI